MNPSISRRRFLQNSAAAVAAVGSGHLLLAETFTGPKAGAAPAAGPTQRVFVANFSHETNTFHPLKTSSFYYPKTDANFSLPGWKEANLVAVPGVSAHPSGGGTIEEAPCREAMNRVVASLREAMPVNAVLLRLHGAMFAEGVGPAEAVLVGKVRAIVGPRVPIACTFDLHGNIPANLGDSGDILVGLKTAPHTDGGPTAELTGRILLDTLGGKVRPVSYVLPIPMILQGEKAMTTSEPFRSLVEEARRVEREGVPGHPEKILAATLFVGCVWTDSPDTGVSVMITADGSRKAARAAAIHLARKIWDARHQFAFGCETAELEEGVRRALEAKEPKVLLTDSGDNVTASTSGDLPIVLRHLVERKVTHALVFGIQDPQSVARCFDAGEGKTVRLSIGAFIEKRFGPPFETEAQVVRVVTQRRAAVVRIGGVTTVLGAAFMGGPGDYEPFGLDPSDYKVVVTKCGYRFPGQDRIAPRHIMLLTPGAGDMRIERLNYVRRKRPAFPFEKDAQFDPAAAPE
jgi:microcystin degradation protein MlrC